MADEVYEALRNKLIPAAEKHASSNAGPRPAKRDGAVLIEKWAQTWNRSFHTMMNTLAKQAGLVRILAVCC